MNEIGKTAAATASGQTLDHVFGALADTTRRAIVQRLSLGETSVSDLAQPFDMSLPAITKHLKVLEATGLISSRKEGRTRYCRLQAETMRQAADWLNYYEQFWTDKLDRLDRYFSQHKAEKGSGRKPDK